MWIRPSLLSLEFIRQEVTSLGLEAVASVGCGCGTLEWLLQMATGPCSIELQTKDHTKVYNHGEGPYKGLLLAESSYYRFHIEDTMLNNPPVP